jgi:shikimate dehydrogenase
MTNLQGVQNRDSIPLDATRWYAAILGARPSQGARSPTLWNAAFEGLNINARMHPMDVSAENLAHVVEELKHDPHFIGGAVTTPHKQAILALLDDVEEEAGLIGAVNALYRKDGKLIGANTDGAGAIKSLETHAGSLTGKTILLVGLGGAGQAVGIYLARALGSTGRLLVANRTQETANAFAQKSTTLCPTTVVHWPVQQETIAQADVIVNATTLGFQGSGQEELSAIDEANMPSLRPDTWVFDLIYQPPQTPLLRLAQTHGAHTLNGKEMNLEQAVIACEKAIRGMNLPSSDSIKPLMQSASQFL